MGSAKEGGTRGGKKDHPKLRKKGGVSAIQNKCPRGVSGEKIPTMALVKFLERKGKEAGRIILENFHRKGKGEAHALPKLA